MDEASSTPNRSVLHAVLGMIGIAALVLYILACRPSWSPDGSKLLYPFWDADAKQAGVALFDRKSKTSTTVFVSTPMEGAEDRISSAQWASDGSRGIFIFYGSKSAHVAVLPLGSKKPARIFELPESDSGSPMFLPVPEVRGNLYVSGEKFLGRLGLETGETQFQQFQDEQDFLLYADNDRVLYIKNYLEPKTGKEEKTKEDKTKEEKKQEGEKQDGHNYEFGELDQKDLSLHAWFVLRNSDLKARGLTEIIGFVDVAPKTSQIAVIASAGEPEREVILLLGKNGPERIISPQISAKKYKLGNPQWSRDGQFIYAAALTWSEDEKTAQFAIDEVPLQEGTARLDAVVNLTGQEADSDIIGYLQIALSPDGKLIAMATAHVDKIEPANRALYLVDMSKPARPVSKYPPPRLPAPATTGAKE